MYKIEVQKVDITNIDYLRDDIINWRTDFINKISKDIIMNFANLYIKQTKL